MGVACLGLAVVVAMRSANLELAFPLQTPLIQASLQSSLVLQQCPFHPRSLPSPLLLLLVQVLFEEAVAAWTVAKAVTKRRTEADNFIMLMWICLKAEMINFYADFKIKATIELQRKALTRQNVPDGSVDHWFSKTEYTFDTIFRCTNCKLWHSSPILRFRSMSFLTYPWTLTWSTSEGYIKHPGAATDILMCSLRCKVIM